jgi:hypothetical protein
MPRASIGWTVSFPSGASLVSLPLLFDAEEGSVSRILAVLSNDEFFEIPGIP